MISLPDFDKAFEHENNFYFTSETIRTAKLLAHYELYKKVENLPGVIIECGVFKGVSLIRFATFRELFSNSYSKKIIGFDIFGEFPETNFDQDQKPRKKFIENAGNHSISREQLRTILVQKGINNNVELIEGDICQTIPAYLEKHPELKISLLNLDTDIYEPAVVILECLYPRIVKRGVLILDDYGVFPGETQAVDEYFVDHDITIQKFPFCITPSYIIKN